MRARSKDHLVPMGQLAVAAVAGGALLATNAVAQSAREVRDATPYLAVENEPPPKLIVDAPLAAALTQGIVWIQYRVENVHIQCSGRARSTYLHGSGITPDRTRALRPARCKVLVKVLV